MDNNKDVIEVINDSNENDFNDSDSSDFFKDTLDEDDLSDLSDASDEDDEDTFDESSDPEDYLKKLIEEQHLEVNAVQKTIVSERRYNKIMSDYLQTKQELEEVANFIIFSDKQDVSENEDLKATKIKFDILRNKFIELERVLNTSQIGVLPKKANRFNIGDILALRIRTSDPGFDPGKFKETHYIQIGNNGEFQMEPLVVPGDSERIRRIQNLQLVEGMFNKGPVIISTNDRTRGNALVEYVIEGAIVFDDMADPYKYKILGEIADVENLLERYEMLKSS